MRMNVETKEPVCMKLRACVHESHGYGESLKAHWLRVSHDLALGLHGVSSILQPKTIVVDGKSTWNPMWQV